MDVEAANDRWQQELDGVRKQYMDWQTRESKNAWQKEQKVMYDAIYETWQEDGNACKKKLLASETAWEGWRDQSGFTKLETADMAKAKEAWDTWKQMTTRRRTGSGASSMSTVLFPAGPIRLNRSSAKSALKSRIARCGRSRI